MTEYSRLTGLDSLMLRMDRNSSYMHTLKIAVLDPSTDPAGWSFERYRTQVEHHLFKAPMLRRRWVPTPGGIHQPVWVEDPDFDLDVHLRRIACPAPGSPIEFCALVEQIYSHPLNPARPLWQLWVVEGLEGGRVALLWLLHHSYTDGAGLRAILEATVTTEPLDAPAEIPEWAPPPLPSARRRIGWAARDLPALIRRVPPALKAIRQRRDLERTFVASGSGTMPVAADRAKPQPFGGLLTRGRRFACESYPLAQMREVRDAFGGTLNDVFLSCVSGSLRTFFEHNDMDRGSPSVASMAFTLVPVAQRSAPLGNYSALDYVWMHSDIADPVERLQATRASAQVTKEHFKRVSGANPLVLVDLIPSTVLNSVLKLEERFDGRHSPGCNMFVSNMPGPAKPLFVGRWVIERWWSTGQVFHGSTLNFTGWSYGDQFNLCVLAGSRQIPDAWPLVHGFTAALDELCELARAGKTSPKAKDVAAS